MDQSGEIAIETLALVKSTEGVIFQFKAFKIPYEATFTEFPMCKSVDELHELLRFAIDNFRTRQIEEDDSPDYTLAPFDSEIDLLFEGAVDTTNRKKDFASSLTVTLRYRFRIFMETLKVVSCATAIPSIPKKTPVVG
jgi:hypothetical protein